MDEKNFRGRLPIGGATWGGLLGILLGAVVGSIYGILVGNTARGLDGALIGGLVGAVAGATWGVILIFTGSRQSGQHSADRTDSGDAHVESSMHSKDATLFHLR